MNNIKIWPRSQPDRGGYVCMPLAVNVPNGRPGWELTTCTECGRKCWRLPEMERVIAQGAVALCTNCALMRA